MIYFDNAATTQVRPEVAGIVQTVMCEDYGNPSSTHTMGRAAAAHLKNARASVASVLGCKADEVYFTSGGTEADNWAVLGSAQLQRRKGRHVITSAIEHDAVLAACSALEKDGAEITYLMPDKSGRIPVADFAAAVRDDTVLASVMMTNNETGATNDIPEMAAELRRRNPDALFHTDAVQAFCKTPVSVRALGVDLLSASAHKIYGPKGVGALYIRDGVRLPPMHVGGGQEKAVRGGTEALPLIAGFGKAAELADAEMDESASKAASLRMLAVSEVAKRLPNAVIIGEGDCPYILNLSLPGFGSEVLMNFMEAKGICISRSSACKKGARSHVLEAMRLKDAVIDGAVRISFSMNSTAEEVGIFVDALCDAAARLIHA